MGTEWASAEATTNGLVWGRTGGLQFAIPPAGFHPPEPRGLIRIGYPVLTNGGYDLVNFIAIEPVVKGRKGFSELEKSKLDDKPGKRLSVVGASHIAAIAPGVEALTVKLAVERFENGAEVLVEIQQRSDEPDEIRLTTRAAPGSAPMDFCILTATMGNRTRAREIWLKDETVSSKKLYADYHDLQFAPHTVYPLDRLMRLKNGDVLVAVTNDEENPGATQPFPRPNFWYYTGAKVTQYWKKPAGAGRDLSAVVNARFVYWGSRQPIPNGISFENFELREPFRDGQSVIFGVTPRTPTELGFKR